MMPNTNTPLPADLPTDWALDMVVSPGGTEVGLTPQHGYNYLMEQVNAAQRAINGAGGFVEFTDDPGPRRGKTLYAKILADFGGGN